MITGQIQQKISELQSLMSQYKHDLGVTEKELYQAIWDYQEVLKEEKLKQIHQELK